MRIWARSRAIVWSLRVLMALMILGLGLVVLFTVGRITQLKNEVRLLTERANNCEQDLAKNSDNAAFAQADSLKERDERRAALVRFTESYPNSELISKAKTFIDEIDGQIKSEERAQQEALREQERSVKEEQRARESDLLMLKNALARGQAPYADVYQSILPGHTQAEVYQALGRPRSTSGGDFWSYDDIAIDRVANRWVTLYVSFEGGVVKKVSW